MRYWPGAPQGAPGPRSRFLLSAPARDYEDGLPSVVVPVTVVLSMAVAVVDVVDVVAMGHRDMAALRAVLVSVAFMDCVAAGLALVHVVFAHAMQMTVVNVVDVVTVRHGDMAALKTVQVSVAGVSSRRCCFRSHWQPLLNPPHVCPSPADAPRRLCQAGIKDAFK